MIVHGEYFCGNKISEYGLENGYVDYGTLAKSFDAVLNNEIIQKTYDIGYWEQESGFVENEEEIEELKEEIEALEDEQAEIIDSVDDYMLYAEKVNKVKEIEDKIDELNGKIEELEEEQENSYNAEIFQYYIVDDNGAEILKEINEIVYYNEELDMYVWGVTHYGTAWSYVLTDIKCNVPYEEE